MNTLLYIELKTFFCQGEKELPFRSKAGFHKKTQRYSKARKIFALSFYSTFFIFSQKKRTGLKAGFSSA
ncbi:hypothetical protein A4244_07020 [Bacillus badius]|nr:hypothetical protein A4244_07020 [Bacillus badius]KZR60359.1 hypothetical protein A3781_09290 [Bacillus badius]OCS83786.1 hypothetical protein A6M11_07030 [Bacillus badius]OVE52925.1 hypothetical protein B1A98_04835 [Bacillus badius]